MMAQKDKVVGELTKGVEFLLKKNKSEAIVGEARITAPGKVEVKGKDGSVRTLETKNIVIATGSEVARCRASPSMNNRSYLRQAHSRSNPYPGVCSSSAAAISVSNSALCGGVWEAKSLSSNFSTASRRDSTAKSASSSSAS